MESNFHSLFVLLYIPVVSFVEEIIDDHEKARDIAIDVFRQNRAELEGYDSSGDLTEVIQLLQKKALIESFCELRKRNKCKEALEKFLEANADYIDSVEQTLIAIELDQLMKKIDDGLSAHQRRGMELFTKGVQPREAASWLKISDVAYRSLKSAVVEKYKKALRLGGFLIILILLILSIMAR